MGGSLPGPGGALDSVGVAPAVAVWRGPCRGSADAGDDSAGAASDGVATVVTGVALEVTGADVARGARSAELGTAVVTGAEVVVGAMASRDLGGVVGGTGVLTTVVVTVAGKVSAGASGEGGAGGADAYSCRGGSLAAGAGVATTTGACGGGARGTCFCGASTAGGAGGTTVVGAGAGGMSRAAGGMSRTGLGGLTGVVVTGPVTGSANAGVIPPVSAANEITVPEASTTTAPRPRQAHNAALIVHRLLSSLRRQPLGHRCHPPVPPRRARSRSRRRCGGLTPSVSEHTHSGHSWDAYFLISLIRLVCYACPETAGRRVRRTPTRDCFRCDGCANRTVPVNIPESAGCSGQTRVF